MPGERCVLPGAHSDEHGVAASNARTQKAAHEHVELNTALHMRLLRSGGARPSTYASAMRALEELRRKRNR